MSDGNLRFLRLYMYECGIDAMLLFGGAIYVAFRAGANGSAVSWLLFGLSAVAVWRASDRIDVGLACHQKYLERITEED